MILFGHIGFTLAFVFLVFLILKEDVDYRYVIAGSMLPDMIDKPIGHYLFKEIFSNGRIFGHTLLFILALLGLAYILNQKYNYSGFIFLTLGAVMHQVEDQMWLYTSTTLWPVFGIEFPRITIDDYGSYILERLFTVPEVYVPELIGLVLMIAFVVYYRLYTPSALKSFILDNEMSTRSAPEPGSADVVGKMIR